VEQRRSNSAVAAAAVGVGGAAGRRQRVSLRRKDEGGREMSLGMREGVRGAACCEKWMGGGGGGGLVHDMATKYSKL
jgi:hypothetical protein